jgi:hypothetical protein
MKKIIIYIVPGLFITLVLIVSIRYRILATKSKEIFRESDTIVFANYDRMAGEYEISLDEIKKYDDLATSVKADVEGKCVVAVNDRDVIDKLYDNTSINVASVIPNGQCACMGYVWILGFKNGDLIGAIALMHGPAADLPSGNGFESVVFDDLTMKEFQSHSGMTMQLTNR